MSSSVLSRFQRFKQSREISSNKLISTSGGNSGGITITGLLVDMKLPVSRTAGSAMFKIIVTEGGKVVIPGARKKNKVTGEYTQETYDVEKYVPENGSSVSISLYLQASESFEPEIFNLVTVCGVVRNGDYINCKKVIPIGNLSDAPDSIYDIPTPWDMESNGIKFQTIPFVMTPIDETVVSKDDGLLFFSSYDSNKPSKFLSDEGHKIMHGPFQQKKWTSENEKTCDVSMSLWNPKANLEQFGIVSDEAWQKLASQFTTNLCAKGVMTVSNNENKSLSLIGNNERNENDYAVIAYCSYLVVDMLKTLQTCAVQVNADFVKTHFDNEDVIESEYATDNPLSKSTSKLICLSEWTGNLKKVLARKDATFYVVADFKSDEDKFAVLHDTIENRNEKINSSTKLQYVYVYLSKGCLKKGKRERD